MKTKYAICCVLIALAALSTLASAEHVILGDVNADGRITTADSLLALRMAVGSAAPEMDRADVNADGMVNSLDALMILAMAQKMQVCVNSPEVVSGAFEVTIDICNAVNLDSGQFDLSFDPDVVNVTAVHDGDISGRQVPVESWSFVDAGTIRVLFNLPGVTGVSGSGQIARISFGVTGSPGDSCVLDMSDGGLFDTGAEEISALWIDCEVVIEGNVPVNQVRNVYTGEIFSFIQAAIDDPDTLDGHTIEVGDGVCLENVQVTKSLTIQSLNGPANCVIRAAHPDGDVFNILSNNVCISGFTVKGATAPAGAGIYIGASHCNISNNNVTNNHCGICLHSSNNMLTNNRMSGNRYNLDVYGIQNIDASNLVDGKPVYYWVGREDQQIPDDAGFVGVVNSTNITVKDLTLTKNGVGVLFAYTNDSRIENVTVSDNDWGICLECSSNNTLTDNTMSMNSDNFRVSGDALPHYIQNIDASNLVDGKPIYYWVGREDQQIPDDAGFVGVVNSTNITVKDLTLTKNGAGMLSVYTTNSRIENVTISDSDRSISLRDSSNNMLINNKGRIGLRFSSNNVLMNNIGYISLGDSINNMLMNNTGSICLHDSSYNTLIGNTASNKKSFGIFLWDSNNNVLSKNKVSNSWYGIWLFPSDGNTLTNNIVSNNDVGIRMYASDSNMLMNNTVSDNICGVHLLSGSSCNKIYHNNFINNTDDVESSGTNNIWNSTEKTMYIYKEARYTNYLGNYWDDYGGRDADNDGIGNTPHSIDSDRDNYPLMERSGNYLISKPGHVPDNETQVCVNAPEIVSGAFNVTIDVHNVVDLDSGEFNLSFDPGVVNVTAVRDGGIGGTPVPIEWWEFMDAGTIRVMFNLMALNGVNGSGQIVRISFEVTGSPGDSCVLDISDGRLVDTGADMIPAIWTRDEVTVRMPVPVMVRAPEVVSGIFDAAIDIENVIDLDSGEFDLSFDSSVVNVTAIHDGNVGGRRLSIEWWDFVDAGTIRVIFDLPGAAGVSGSGQIATIGFEVTGSQYDTSVLDLSDGRLVDTESNEIPALWDDSAVTVGVPVTVRAPEVVSIVSGAFNATIEIEDVRCINGGQFDLRYDPDVLKVLKVEHGDIDGTEIPIVGVRRFEDDDHDRYRILFKLDGADGASGSGYVARINFELTGSPGDTSVLDLTNGNLAGTEGVWILAVWINDTVTIGVPVTVNAPPVVSDTFNVTIDIENVTDLDSGQFELSFDSDVVTVEDVGAGNIGDTEIPVRWSFGNTGTIEVLFNLPGLRGVSGSGYVAKINFELKGLEGDNSILDISNGLLVDNRAEKIPAIWIDDCVTIGEHIPANRVHNINTGEDFSFIQAAIDDPDTQNGHIIKVDDGVYRENVKVTKSLTIRSLNGSADCIIQDAGSDNVVTITADHVNISGFTVVRRLIGPAFYKTGIYLGASYCNVSNNTCSNNGIGICLYGSSKSNISENVCSNNDQAGICLDRSCNNRLAGNDMFENGIVIRGDSPDDYTHEIDETNMVNGKPVYYWTDIESGRIPEGAGQVILANCMGILVENQELNDASVGVEVAFSSNITVRDNICSNNHDVGIHFFYSSNSSISSNDCQNNWNDGIQFHGLSRSSVSNNICSNSNSTGVYAGIYGWTLPYSDSDGIHLTDSRDNSISNNNCSNNEGAGIHITDSRDNSISNNICSNNRGGICLSGSNDSISHNNCSTNHEGIRLSDSDNSRLTGNTMSENGIVISGDSPGGYTCEIDETNTVNGKPVYYWKYVSGKSIPDGAGQVILVSCEGVLVENQELNNASVGVEVAFSSNVTIRWNNCSNNHYAGIHFLYSNDNAISGNNCSDNGAGIDLHYSSNNHVAGNNCTNNEWTGVRLYGSGNSISGNNCSNNRGDGIGLSGSGNTVSSNDCLKNHGDGILLYGLDTACISNNDCSTNCRAGIRIYRSNDNSISSNTCSNNRDGVLIFFNDSYSNVIYLNNFINNSDNIATQSSRITNIWSSPSKIGYTYRDKTFTNYLGNYCSDYDGNDANGDGIGDVPYNIDPDCPDRDNYPLMERFESYII
jgi:parallel beta-helix repeat protein